MIDKTNSGEVKEVNKVGVEGWHHSEPDGTWAYGVSVNGLPAQGGFVGTEREAIKARDELLQAYAPVGGLPTAPPGPVRTDQGDVRPDVRSH